jgi:hypothetical protein
MDFHADLAPRFAGALPTRRRPFGVGCVIA